jgi:hypothetical protein
MNGWMDGWYWHWKNSFSLEGLHETNQWMKTLLQFLFFKKGRDGEPIHSQEVQGI